MPPPAMVFPYKDGLEVLANFFGPTKGVYLLPLPLRSGATLELISAGSPQFARATVNLFWAELMGVGIVDPPFAFDLERQDPGHPPHAP